MEKCIIGLDIGGTNLRIGAVTGDMEVPFRQVTKSEEISGANDPLKALGDKIAAFMRETNLAPLAVSIGVPSSVRKDNATVVCTTNLKNGDGKAIFQNANIVSYLQKVLKIPVYVNNDTSNILLCDIYHNHLENDPVTAGIYIGTGVGASVVIDGHVFKGADGVALDLGHIPYYKSYDRCSCGKCGCCECYASGWRLEQIREEHYPKDRIRDLFLLHGEEEPLTDFLYACSHVFSVMATIFNPSTIVAGGGVLEMQGFPRERFEKMVAENTGYDVMSCGFRYVYSRPYPEKGIIGAALYAQKLMNQ
ncbi:MAG: ROK family protein [Clostridium sp.]|nr:ROK family protein [Clostridium sp.]